MGELSTSLSHAVLAEHAGFIESLARRLAVDEFAAQDLVQETWLAALEGQPSLESETPGGGLRAWLARVLYNRAALRLRTEGRRRDREAQVAAIEAQPDTARLVERMDLHRAVMDSVMSLPESDRELVLWRYFEGLDGAAMAARRGVPHATVRTQLHRALRQLRARLKREVGGTGAYIAALRVLVPEARNAAPLVPSFSLFTAAALMKLTLTIISLSVAGVLYIGTGANSAELTKSTALVDPPVTEELAELPTADLQAPPVDEVVEREEAAPLEVITPHAEVASVAIAALRVVDSATGADLDGVRVLVDVPHYRLRTAPGDHGPENVLIEDAQSPVELPAAEGLQSYWIGATGHTWASVQFDRKLGGERKVALDAAAQLDVEIVGSLKGLAPQVRLYPSEQRGRPTAAVERTPDAGHLSIDGLAAGSYRVCLEVGYWFDPPTELGSTTVELGAGDHARVTLEIDYEGLQSVPVALTGEVRLSGEIDGLVPNLRIKPAEGAALRVGDDVSISADALRETAPGVFAFNAGKLTPGRYLVIVHPLQYHETFDLPSAPLRDLTIEVSDIEQVEVRVIPSEEGVELTPDQLSWTGTMPENASMWFAQKAISGEEPGLFTFHAPIGSIKLSVTASGNRLYSGGVEIGKGENSFNIDLAPSYALDVVLLDGTTSVPFDWSWLKASLYPINGDEADSRASKVNKKVSPEHGGLRIRSETPGRYRLELSAPPGYRPLASREIELQVDGVDKLEIELERED